MNTLISTHVGLDDHAEHPQLTGTYFNKFLELLIVRGMNQRSPSGELLEERLEDLHFALEDLIRLGIFSPQIIQVGKFTPDYFVTLYGAGFLRAITGDRDTPRP